MHLSPSCYVTAMCYVSCATIPKSSQAIILNNKYCFFHWNGHICVSLKEDWNLGPCCFVRCDLENCHVFDHALARDRVLWILHVVLLSFYSKILVKKTYYMFHQRKKSNHLEQYTLISSTTTMVPRKASPRINSLIYVCSITFTFEIHNIINQSNTQFTFAFSTIPLVTFQAATHITTVSICANRIAVTYILISGTLVDICKEKLTLLYHYKD